MNKKIWILLVVLAAFVACGFGGYHLYKQNGVTTQLKVIADRDNLMITEVLKMSSVTPNATWAEVFGQLDKNREEREENIRTLEVMDAYTQKDAVQRYIKILRAENEVVRATSLNLRALFQYTEAQTSYQKGKRRFHGAVDQAEAAKKSGDSDELQRQIDNATAIQESTDAGKSEVVESFAQLKRQSREMERVLGDWSKMEQEFYPALLPARNVQSIINSKIEAANEFLAIKSPFEE